MLAVGADGGLPAEPAIRGSATPHALSGREKENAITSLSIMGKENGM